jgi:hypothetical protein
VELPAAAATAAGELHYAEIVETDDQGRETVRTAIKLPQAPVEAHTDAADADVDAGPSLRQPDLEADVF